MFDMPSFGLALASAKNILDLIKSTNDAQLAISVSQEVSNIQSQFIDLQQKIMGIQKERDNACEELARLKDFRQHDSALWRTLPDGSEDGPFCPTCHSLGYLIRLQPIQGAGTDREFWLLYCPREHDAAKAPYGHPRREHTFRIPKVLIASNYFYIPPAVSPA